MTNDKALHLALTALDEHFAESVKHHAEIVVMGLDEGDPADGVIAKFKAGIKIELAAHAQMAAALNACLAEEETAP